MHIASGIYFVGFSNFCILADSNFGKFTFVVGVWRIVSREIDRKDGGSNLVWSSMVCVSWKD